MKSSQIAHIDPTPGFRTTWTLGLGWTVFFLVWTLFMLVWGQGDIPLKTAAYLGVISTVATSVLGYGVWKLTRFVEWHGTLRFVLIALHLGAAIVFALSWMTTTLSLESVWQRGSIDMTNWTPQILAWRLFMGIWLFVLIAGLSHATRISIRLREQKQVTARAEALAARANLDAMRSQLHPHFLFNALHSVSSLIDTDPETASNAMEMLGDLLRYAIRDRESDTVKLDDEWQFVEDYVALQRFRFGDRVTVDMVLAPEAKTLRIPPFILQPLVENAFIHGMTDREEGGTIRITAVLDQDGLTLSVDDNGSGYTGTNGGGTGLENLRQRLEALYGTSASLAVEGQSGRGTHARIQLPVRLLS